MAKAVPAADIEAVWSAWRDRQRVPSRCVLSEHRERRIRTTLRRFTVEQLTTLVRFAFDSDWRIPTFWRGETTANHKGVTYTALEQLLGPEKVARRVEMALAWDAGEDEHEVMGDGGGESNAEAPDTLGPVARLRQRARGASPVSRTTRSKGRVFGQRQGAADAEGE